MAIRPLSGNLQIKAQLELNEVPSRIQEDLKQIRDWLDKQAHLKCRTENQWLLSFLRGCKFSLQRTKEKLDLYYTMRSLTPEFFQNRDPFLPDIQECLKAGLVVVLPTQGNSTCPAIGIVRAPADPEKNSFITALKVTFMIVDILINESDNFVVAGHHILLDLKGTNYKHIVQMTPAILKKAIVCAQNAYPTRPKSFHCVNTPSIFESVYNVLKTFGSKKIVDRVQFHSADTIDEMYKSIPSSVLPEEYGGEGGSINELVAHWKEKVESYRGWFLEDAQYCSNETSRPGKAKTSAEMFGVEGSFRMLDVD